jgi:hypothetical protein
LEFAFVCAHLLRAKYFVLRDGGRTFDHVDIIGDEVDIILHFQTGMSRASQDEVT